MRKLIAIVMAVFSFASLEAQTIQEKRWKNATVRTSRQSEVRWIARQIERNKWRYEPVSKKIGIPWQVLGSIHNMEASLSFNKHIHNGDPLTARTKLVPKGRPKTGTPPFKWEASCIDAMYYDGMDKVNWKSLTISLDKIEAYNGTGYKRFHPQTPTPYLWSATSVYGTPPAVGKYTSDGKWSSSAVSKQVGVCAVLKELGFKW